MFFIAHTLLSHEVAELRRGEGALAEQQRAEQEQQARWTQELQELTDELARLQAQHETAKAALLDAERGAARMQDLTARTTARMQDLTAQVSGRMSPAEIRAENILQTLEDSSDEVFRASFAALARLPDLNSKFDYFLSIRFPTQ